MKCIQIYVLYPKIVELVKGHLDSFSADISDEKLLISHHSLEKVYKLANYSLEKVYL